MASKSEMTDTTVTSSGASPSVPTVIAPPRWRGTAPPIDCEPVDVREIEQTGVRWLEDRRLMAGLVSTILHTIFLIVIALLTYPVLMLTKNVITIDARTGEPTETVTLEVMSTEDDRLTHEPALSEQPVTVQIFKSNETRPIQSPLKSDENAPMDPHLAGQLASGAATEAKSQHLRMPGGGLSGRTPQGRSELGERFGATPQSEAALDLALRWLADHQRDNGSWSFNLSLDPCNGQCRHSKKSKDSPTPVTGSTGLALLAFLGAGHTHQDGPYAENIKRGIYFLRSIGSESTSGYDFQRGSMYGHGIALMALGEALSMTRTDEGYETDLFDLVDLGSRFTCAAQHPNGSWGYVPGSPGDTTITGWQTFSLIAAKRNGIDLRSTTLPRVKEYLLSVRNEKDWSFGYKSDKGEPTMTAIAVTLMMYLGQSPGYTPLDEALDGIARRGPTLTNVYHDYYATMALHHARHKEWDKWNKRLRDHLVATQATAGHERGSWHFKDKWGDVGGRLYTTAMCAMMLEVYYRYLPLYDEIEDFPL